MPEETAETVVEEEITTSNDHCRHCGAPAGEGQSGDWLCAECDRFQNTTACPLCGQAIAVNMLPLDQQPSAKPKRGSK